MAAAAPMQKRIGSITTLPRRSAPNFKDGTVQCKRDRCVRNKGISEWGCCSDHQCTTPTCPTSKSNKVKFCDACVHYKGISLPPGWHALMQPEAPIYICEKTQVAQWLHPGGSAERAFERKSNMLLQKRKKGVPIQYVIHPQPADLPDPWEVCLAVPDPGKGGDYSTIGAMQIYVNTADNRIQRSDPRPPPEDEEGPLPAGWEQLSDEGEAYFHNLNTDVMTYEDPRHVVNPTPSQYLQSKYQTNPFFNEGQASKFGTLPRQESGGAGGGRKKVQEVWKIGPCDMVAFADLDDNLTWEDEIPECVRSKVYNRYMDILPNPKTRINLPIVGGDPTTEYVNANWVRGPDGNPKHYICAMGPKPTTVDQYWRMLWQEKPLAIVMITGIMEKGQPKCERYWPGLADGKTIMKFDSNRIRVATMKSDPSPNGYVRSTLKAVGPDGKGGKCSHEFEHFWYNTWPDHGVPRKGSNPMYATDCIGMVQEVNKYVHKRNAKLKRTGSLVLVHCSAGIGRTGTYVCLDHSMYLLSKNKEVDLIKVVENVRNDRCALVQHPAQFKFVHAGTVEFAKKSGQRVRVAAATMDEATMTRKAKMTEEAKKKQRAAEKQEALSRIARAKARRASFKAPPGKGQRRGSAVVPASEGELDLGFISFEGNDYKFYDPDGDGHMDINEAASAGFPRQLFRLLDKDRDGKITPAEFKRFQREQRRLKRSASAESTSSCESPTSPNPFAEEPAAAAAAPAGGWPD